MSKFFMYGTALGGLEQMMMLVPNFTPRGSGVIIVKRLNDERGDVSCKYCEGYIAGKCCAEKCFYFRERLEAGAICYADILKNCFGKMKILALKNRLKLIGSSFQGELFLNQKHKARFYYVCRVQNIPIHERVACYLATLFLLTADDVLWCFTERNVYLNSFDFTNMHLRAISTDNYALYLTAKTICTGKEYIKISEIADANLISDTAFKAIINATLIEEYGAQVFSITE